MGSLAWNDKWTKEHNNLMPRNVNGYHVPVKETSEKLNLKLSMQSINVYVSPFNVFWIKILQNKKRNERVNVCSIATMIMWVNVILQNLAITLCGQTENFESIGFPSLS
jgi:hypothetical protein